MTEAVNLGGRPAVFPFRQMEVGDTFEIPVPTGADVKRVARNVSQFGIRYDRFYRCKTDRQTRIMVITRIR